MLTAHPAAADLDAAQQRGIMKAKRAAVAYTAGLALALTAVAPAASAAPVERYGTQDCGILVATAAVTAKQNSANSLYYSINGQYNLTNSTAQQWKDSYIKSAFWYASSNSLNTSITKGYCAPK